MSDTEYKRLMASADLLERAGEDESEEYQLILAQLAQLLSEEES